MGLTALPEGSDRLSRRQKRELGLLPLQVLRGTRELVKEGEITSDMSAAEMTFVYASSVASSPEYGAAWRQVQEGTYGADWDGIIQFLTQLFELLMKFLPLFI